MATRTLFNQLELAFAPICNYDFVFIKDDEDFRRHLQSSTLYVIAQRPELTFDIHGIDGDGNGQVILDFLIRQKGHSSVLTCKLPVYQEAYAQDITKDFHLRFQYAHPKPNPMQPPTGYRLAGSQHWQHGNLRHRYPAPG